MWANLADDNKGTVKTSGSFGGRGTYGPFLVMLKADKQAVLVRARGSFVHAREEENQDVGRGVSQAVLTCR